MDNNNNFNEDSLFDASLSQENEKNMSEQPSVYTTINGQKIIRAKKSNLPNIQEEKAKKKSVAPTVMLTVFIMIITIVIILLFYGKSKDADNNNGETGITVPVKEIPTFITASENGELYVYTASSDIVEVSGNTYTINGRMYTVQKDKEGNITGILDSEGNDVSVKNENGVIESIKDENGNSYKVIVRENDTEGFENEISGSIISIDYTKKAEGAKENVEEGSNNNSNALIGTPSIDKPTIDSTSIETPGLVTKPTIESPSIETVISETPGIVGIPSIAAPEIEVPTIYIPTKKSFREGGGRDI